MSYFPLGWLGTVPTDSQNVSIFYTLAITLGKSIHIYFTYVRCCQKDPGFFGRLQEPGQENCLLCVIAAAVGIAYGSVSNLFGVSFALGAFLFWNDINKNQNLAIEQQKNLYR